MSNNWNHKLPGKTIITVITRVRDALNINQKSLVDIVNILPRDIWRSGTLSQLISSNLLRLTRTSGPRQIPARRSASCCSSGQR